MSPDHLTLERIQHNLEDHALKDENYQTTMLDTTKRIEEKLDAQIKATGDMIETYASLSSSSKLILKIAGVLVGIAGGIAAIKYLLLGIIK